MEAYRHEMPWRVDWQIIGEIGEERGQEVRERGVGIYMSFVTT
jgi:hypothetical protein